MGRSVYLYMGACVCMRVYGRVRVDLRVWVCSAEEILHVRENLHNENIYRILDALVSCWT